MPGKPQRKGTGRSRSTPPLAPDRPPLDSTPIVRIGRPPGPQAPIVRVPHDVRLSPAYGGALAASLTPEEAVDHDLARAALLRQAAARGGGRVTVADAVAASMVARTINLIGRDGVVAARELADRTEGPVVQRIEAQSIRYVVSMTPAQTGPVDPSGPLTLSEWEAQARLEDEASQASQAALLRIAQGGDDA